MASASLQDLTRFYGSLGRARDDNFKEMIVPVPNRPDIQDRRPLERESLPFKGSFL